MPSKSDLQRGDLISMAGMTEDIMTYWMRRNLLDPIGGKAGVKFRTQRFAYYEANVLALSMQLHAFGAKIEALHGITRIYRDAVRWAAGINLTHEEAMLFSLHETEIEWHLEEYFAEGDADISSMDQAYVKYSRNRLKDVDLRSRFELIASHVRTLDDLRHLRAFVEITAQPVTPLKPYATHFWPTEAGWKRGAGPEGQVAARADGALTTLSVDVFGVLLRVWNKSAVKAAPSSIDLTPAR